jgi:hypothetical protein
MQAGAFVVSNFNSVPATPRNLLLSYLTGWRYKPLVKSRPGHLNRTPCTAQYPFRRDQVGCSNKVSETSYETRLWGSIADIVPAVAPSLQRFGNIRGTRPSLQGPTFDCHPGFARPGSGYVASGVRRRVPDIYWRTIVSECGVLQAASSPLGQFQAEMPRICRTLHRFLKLLHQ